MGHAATCAQLQNIWRERVALWKFSALEAGAEAVAEAEVEADAEAEHFGPVCSPFCSDDVM